MSFTAANLASTTLRNLESASSSRSVNTSKSNNNSIRSRLLPGAWKASPSSPEQKSTSTSKEETFQASSDSALPSSHLVTTSFSSSSSSSSSSSTMASGNVKMASPTSLPPVEASSEEEDFLEKMLKDAEVLASKMSGAAAAAAAVASPIVEKRGHSATTPTTTAVAAAAEDTMTPLLDEAENLLRDLREGAVNSMASGSGGDSVSLLLRRLDNNSKNNTTDSHTPEKEEEEEEDVVPQPQPNALSMKKKGDAIAIASTDSPLGNISRTSAPSSVYVLHHTHTGSDDFSSVGSSSLRAAEGTTTTNDSNKHLTDALVIASMEMASAIKDIQTGSANGSDSPGTPTPSAPDDADNNNEDNDDDSHSDEVSVKDYTSQASVSSSFRRQKMAKAMAAKLEAGIPDFTAATPDAKWETIASAERGDDDYVSLQDFTQEINYKKNNQQHSSSTSRSTMRDIIPPVMKQSRLQLYREQARRQRKRQRMFVVTVIAFVLVYLVWGNKFMGSSGGSDADDMVKNLVTEDDLTVPSLKTTDENVMATSVVTQSDDLQEEEEDKQQMEDGSIDPLVKDEEEETLVDAAEDQEIVVDDVIQKEETPEVTVADDGKKEKLRTEIVVHEEKEHDEAAMMVTESSGADIASPESSGVVRTTNSQDPKVASGSLSPSTSKSTPISVILTEKEQRACKNPFHRIFRKRCRMFAKEMKQAKKRAAVLGLLEAPQQQQHPLPYNDYYKLPSI